MVVNIPKMSKVEDWRTTVLLSNFELHFSVTVRRLLSLHTSMQASKKVKESFHFFSHFLQDSPYEWLTKKHYR